MYPIAFHIGNVAIHWYGILTAIGFLAGSGQKPDSCQNAIPVDGDVSDVKGNRIHTRIIIVRQTFINAECLFQRLAMRILFWYPFCMHLNPSSILEWNLD